MKKKTFIIVSIIAVVISVFFVKFFTNSIHYELDPGSKNSFEIKELNTNPQRVKISEFILTDNSLGICLEYIGNNNSVKNLKNIQLKMFNLIDGKKEEVKVNAKYVMYKDIVPASIHGVKELGILNPLKSFSELASPLEVLKNDPTINSCFTILNEYYIKQKPEKIELQLHIISNDSNHHFTCIYNLKISKYSIVDLMRGTKLKDLKY